MHTIENEKLKVTVADSGAELISVFDKESSTERIWCADPSVWNRHAPILFPFVGKTAGGRYCYAGQSYEMKTQHGFARDMEFECVEAAADHITHRLLPNDRTRAIYPFEFELQVTHRLDPEDPRRLQVEWLVSNHGADTMYYSIGGHPGFTVPVQSSEEREEYFIEFPGCEDLIYMAVNPMNGLAMTVLQYELPLENGFAPFSETLYDTWIFEDQLIRQVRIARPDKTPYVTMDCHELPMLGVWTKEEGNYICLEPWAGRTDDDGFAGSLEEKKGVQQLAAGDSKKWSYSVEFHK